MDGCLIKKKTLQNMRGNLFLKYIDRDTKGKFMCNTTSYEKAI